MANTLGYYDPLFYAQEALIQLEKSLGLAGRVYRAYDKEPNQLGGTIAIKTPSVFEATNVNTSTGGTTQEVNTGSTSMVLSNWKEVKFGLSDKELSFTGEQIISDHIRPAAYALADAIDQSLAGLYLDVPWIKTLTSTVAVTDILAVRQQQFDLAVPLSDEGNMHFMLDGKGEADLLGNSAFAQFQGAGAYGVETQLRGFLGRRYGYEFFANQNTPTHTAGGDADVAGVASAALAGAKTLDVTSVGTTAALKKGDTFTIAGHTQHYVLTANSTASGGTMTGITFEPGLEVATAGSEVLTFEVGSAAATKKHCLAFHRNAFALAMAPLSDMGNMLGAKIATVTDPVSGLSIRSRLFYDGEKSTVKVALDALWGVKTLNRNMAVRARHA
jgi:hypothetical protein